VYESIRHVQRIDGEANKDNQHVLELCQLRGYSYVPGLDPCSFTVQSG
jgi:hypothetical protein